MITKLKIKAKIYQYFQIYLAQDEEDMAMLLKFWNRDIAQDSFSLSMAIGLWQVKHGFYTLHTQYSFKKSIYGQIMNRGLIIIRMLKDDLAIWR